jgi:hypothetical protein
MRLRAAINAAAQLRAWPRARLRGRGQAVAVHHGAVAERERVARAHNAQERVHRQFGSRRPAAAELCLRRQLCGDGLRAFAHVMLRSRCVRTKQCRVTANFALVTMSRGGARPSAFYASALPVPGLTGTQSAPHPSTPLTPCPPGLLQARM